MGDIIRWGRSELAIFLCYLDITIEIQITTKEIISTNRNSIKASWVWLLLSLKASGDQAFKKLSLGGQNHWAGGGLQVWVSTLLFYISLLSGCHYRNPNNNERDHPVWLLGFRLLRNCQWGDKSRWGRCKLATLLCYISLLSGCRYRNQNNNERDHPVW